MADHLALDIETVPAAELHEYSEAVQEKIQQKISRQQDRNPDYNYQLFASTNGDFGKIVCLSLAYVKDEKIKLKSLYGSDEYKLLTDFNQIAKTVDKFIHYNGLGFDMPFILQRMMHHGIRPSTRRLTNLRKFSTEPHFDLMMVYYNWDWSKVMSLGLLAELHGMPSPKGDLSGDKVYEAYRNGEWKRIVRYCEFDTATTVNLWNKLYNYEPVIDVANYEFSDEG